jgi:hypothetical protein
MAITKPNTAESTIAFAKIYRLKSTKLCSKIATIAPAAPSAAACSKLRSAE